MKLRFVILLVGALGWSACGDEDNGGSDPGPGALTVYNHAAGTLGAETWAVGRHVVAGNLTVSAGVLTVEACSVIEMPDGGTLTARDNGAFHFVGRADCPITITSAKPVPAAGDWAYLQVYGSSDGMQNVFDYVVIEYGGGSSYGALWLDSTASLAMSNSTVQHADDVGIRAYNGAELRSFVGNTLTGNAGGAIELGANSVGMLGIGTYSPNTIDGIIVGNEEVDRDQTWLAHDAPYIIGSGFTATTDTGSAHLTINAGATLRLGSGALISVRNNAGLTAAGTASAPVTFTSNSPVGAAGDWNYLGFYGSSVGAHNDLDHTIFEFGGSGAYGTVWVDTGASVAMTDCTVRDSADFGIDAYVGAEFRDFTGNTLTNNADGAIYLGANSVDDLGAGTYGPNDADGIFIRNETVDHDGTWLDLGTRYVVGEGLNIESATGSARLTIEAGTLLTVGDGVQLTVRTNAGLTLAGTSTEHVTITSANPVPAAGDWSQINLYGSSTGAWNTFTFADISCGGAGGYGQVWVDDGAVLTLDNSTFTQSGDTGACDLDVYPTGTVNATSSTYTLCL